MRPADRTGHLGWGLALLGVLAAAGCGKPQLSAEEQALATGGAEVATGLEYSLAMGSLLTEVDLGGGVQREAIDQAVLAINQLLGACVTASAAAAPAVGMSLRFADGGCGVPLTSYRLAGAATVEVVDDGGVTTLHALFQALEVYTVRLDGELELRNGAGSFMYTVRHLQLGYADHQVTLDGQGTVTAPADHGSVVFSGTGSITYDGKTFAFEADRISRNFLGDCYPESGSLKLSYTGAAGSPVSVTLRYDDRTLGGLDSDDSGKVYVDFRGHTVEHRLPARACSGI